jgi:hypothetical protein
MEKSLHRDYPFTLNTRLILGLSDGTNTYLYGVGRIAQYTTGKTSRKERRVLHWKISAYSAFSAVKKLFAANSIKGTAAYIASSQMVYNSAN